MRFRDFVLAALLAVVLNGSAVAACDDPASFVGGICKRLSDTWSQGRHDVLLPLYSYHLRSAYTKEKIESFEENSWGLGYGRTRYDDEGNWHTLYAMGFRDSHGKFQPIAGYGHQWMWGERESLHAGLGYTVFVTARSDIGRYLPLPGILPIASVNYRRTAMNMSFMPGGKGNGNVLFLWTSFGF